MTNLKQTAMIGQKQFIYEAEMGVCDVMQIIVCEDDALYQRSIHDKIDSWVHATDNTDVEVHVFHSSEDLLELLERGFRAHVFFLDIEIRNEMNGLELAKFIRCYDPEVIIVFITNYEEYVYQGYTLNALRYLKKPIIDSDLFPCLDIAYQRYQSLYQEQSVLSLPNEKIVLRYSEIIYIEAHSPNLYISTVNLKQPIIVRYRLSGILNLLPHTLFSPCHRSYIVNISQIRVLRKTSVLLSNNTSLPVSEKFVNELFEKFNQYHQKGQVSL